MWAGGFLAFVLLGVTATAGRAQSAAGAGKLPVFEVATVKPAPAIPRGMVGLYTHPGGRIECDNCTLEMLAQFAFEAPAFRITGGPAWMRAKRYDVVGMPPEDSAARQLRPAGPNTPPTEEQREMLESLLMERFGLRYHRETRIGPVFWLVRTRKEFGGTPARDPSAPPFMSVMRYHGGEGNGEMVGRSATMAYMATRLSTILRLPVIDKTAIAGVWDFDVPAPEAANADIANATIEGLAQLGLKLKKKKGPVAYIVVDSVTEPTPN